MAWEGGKERRLFYFDRWKGGERDLSSLLKPPEGILGYREEGGKGEGNEGRRLPSRITKREKKGETFMYNLKKEEAGERKKKKREKKGGGGGCLRCDSGTRKRNLRHETVQLDHKREEKGRAPFPSAVFPGDRGKREGAPLYLFHQKPRPSRREGERECLSLIVFFSGGKEKKGREKEEAPLSFYFEQTACQFRRGERKLRLPSIIIFRRGRKGKGKGSKDVSPPVSSEAVRSNKEKGKNRERRKGEGEPLRTSRRRVGGGKRRRKGFCSPPTQPIRPKGTSIRPRE